MRPAWNAFYYDGHTADRQPITLTFESAGVRLHLPDGNALLWPIGEVRQTQGSFSSEQVRLEFGADPVAAVLVNEAGFVDAMRRAFPHATGKLRGQRQTTRLFAWSFGALAAAVVLYIWGAPIASAWVAERVPPAWESALGAGVEERVTRSGRLCGDSASLAALRGVLDRLLAAGGALPYRFRMVVIRDTLINAFAAPGGFIAVHSGLIEAATTPEEFAGVLAHEIQHVTRRHSTRGIIREVPMRLAIAAIAGGTGIEGAASIAGSLGALRYRRGDEAEADREGLRLLAAAEVDPSGMVTFMRTLDKEHASAPRIVSYLSSHPNTGDRIARLESLTSSTRVLGRPLMDSSSWKRVRQLCD
jgi:predicted Zn-dependent protease